MNSPRDPDPAEGADQPEGIWRGMKRAFAEGANRPAGFEPLPWRYIIRRIFVAMIVVIALYIEYRLEILYEPFAPYPRVALLAVILSVVAGIYLYRFRCQYLPLYAVCEFLFGLSLAVGAANSATGQALFAVPESFNRTIPIFYSWCAALYIIVRALDNMSKFLDEAGSIQQWDDFFRRNYGPSKKSEQPGNIEAPSEAPVSVDEEPAAKAASRPDSDNRP
jgi:hypothetical protein